MPFNSERINPKISSTCRASKQYSSVDSVSSRASPSPPGEGVARFELTFLGLGEVSRCFLVHETQTERKGGGGNAMYRSTKRQFCETTRGLHGEGGREGERGQRRGA